jgi:tetratricopeptide (TPR) repeat protein
MQEKTPLEKDSPIDIPYYTEAEEANAAANEGNSFKREKKWVEAQRAYEKAISSLEKIPLNFRSELIWLKLASYKANIGYTYHFRQPPQLKDAQTAYLDAIRIMKSQESKIKPDNERWGTAFSGCYHFLSQVSYALEQWQTAEESTQKAIEYLTFQKTPNHDHVRLFAKLHATQGDIYLKQNKITPARKALFLAIVNVCKIAQGTEDDFRRIADYLGSIMHTYFGRTPHNELLTFVAMSLRNTRTNELIGLLHNIDWNGFFKEINTAIAPPSMVVDEKLFSYVLLPILEFIHSNQQNPHFPNTSLRNLSPDQLEQLKALIKNLEDRKEKVESLANQSLTRVIIGQEQRIRDLEKRIVFLERELNEPPQMVAPPQPKPEEKSQLTLDRFFGPLQKTSSRKRNVEKTGEASEGPPAKKINTK